MRKYGKAHVVQDDEQKEKKENEQHNKKRNQETKLRDSMNSEREEQLAKTPTTRPLEKIMLA